ncbi:MAG: hypothetical protein MJA83_01270, partial [Gammaproteobacteria bacterium]|nr:hypothetical protein [Gammaproteobacteria bacterium]
RSPAAAGFYYFFGGVAAIAAIMDIRMLIRQGVSGVQRIVRHLWRMCFAMFMATMAFFLGQARHLPDFIRETHLNVLPVVAVVLVMFFWLFYAFFSKRYKHTGVSRGNYHAETI